MHLRNDVLCTLNLHLKKKWAIYEQLLRKDLTGMLNNHLGAAYLAQAIETPANAASLADKALAQLELAAKLNEAPEVHANLASVHMIKGNAYAAYNHAAKALSSGLTGDNVAGVNGVKGAAEIVKAQYAAAVSSESAATDNADNLFNKGLAQLLNKDYQNALTSFKEASAKNTNMGLAYYGAAIASARLGNADDVKQFSNE